MWHFSQLFDVFHNKWKTIEFPWLLEDQQCHFRTNTKHLLSFVFLRLSAQLYVDLVPECRLCPAFDSDLQRYVSRRCLRFPIVHVHLDQFPVVKCLFLYSFVVSANHRLLDLVFGPRQHVRHRYGFTEKSLLVFVQVLVSVLLNFRLISKEFLWIVLSRRTTSK